MPERAHTHAHTFAPMETMWMSVQFLADPEDRQAKKKLSANYNHSVHLILDSIVFL